MSNDALPTPAATAAAAAAAAAAKQQELEDFAKTFDATPGDVSVSRSGVVVLDETSVRGRRHRSRSNTSNNNKEKKTTRARSSNPVPRGSPGRGGTRVGRKNRRRSTSLDQQPVGLLRTSKTTMSEGATAQQRYGGHPVLRTAQTTTVPSISIRDHFSNKSNTSMPRRDSDDMSLFSAFDTGALHDHLADAKTKADDDTKKSSSDKDCGGNIFTRRAEQDLREVDQSVNLMNAEAGQYDVSESDRAAGGTTTPPSRTRSYNNKSQHHNNNNTSAKAASFLSIMFGMSSRQQQPPTNRSPSFSNRYHKDLPSRGNENLPLHQTPNMKYPRTSMQEIQLGPDPTHHRHTAFYLQQRAAARDHYPWNHVKRFCTKRVIQPVKQLVCSPPFLTAVVLLVTLLFWIPYLQEKVNHRTTVVVDDANVTTVVAPTPVPTRAPTPTSANAHESFLDMAGDLLYGSFGQPRPAPPVVTVVEVVEETADEEAEEDTQDDGDIVVHSATGEATKKTNNTVDKKKDDPEEATEVRSHTASGDISKNNVPEDTPRIHHTAPGEIMSQKDDTVGDTRASGGVTQADREKEQDNDSGEQEQGQPAATGEVSPSDRENDKEEELTQGDRDSTTSDEDIMVLDYHGTLGEQLELFQGVILDQDLSSEETLNDHGSDQFKALMWLAMSSLDDDEKEDTANRRLRQLADTGLTAAQLRERYVAAVFYFATRNDNVDDGDIGVTRPPRNHTGPVAPSKQSLTVELPVPTSNERNNSGRLLSKIGDILPDTVKLPRVGSRSHQEPQGEDDGHLENWLTVEGLCDWEGIACNVDGYVEGVTLPNQSLHGTIPSEMQGFSNLKRLDLTDNFIGSTLPSELGRLGNLQRLELHNNLLEGALPTAYGRLESLEIIHLQYNLLDGHLPSEIGLLSNLRVFNIKENMFSGNVPTQISLLSNLEKVYFDCNELQGPVPLLDASLNRLTAVQLASNQMTGTISEGLCSIAETMRILACDCLEMVECSCCHHCY